MRNPKPFICSYSSNFKPTNLMKNVLRKFLIVLSLLHLKFVQKFCQKNYYRLLVINPDTMFHPKNGLINLFYPELNSAVQKLNEVIKCVTWK